MMLADGTEEWARCAATKGDETEGNVTNLRQGEIKTNSYLFSLRIENIFKYLIY